VARLPRKRRFVEEMGGMNLFFVFGSGGTLGWSLPELKRVDLPGRHARCLAAVGN
jgi:branched-subunit amino acid aminotransferase/4-amino-4-deoxychorismate lyase